MKCSEWFDFTIIVMSMLGLACGSTALVCLWSAFFYGKFSLDTKNKPEAALNAHPAVMMTGFVTAGGLCKSPTRPTLLGYERVFLCSFDGVQEFPLLQEDCSEAITCWDK